MTNMRIENNIFSQPTTAAIRFATFHSEVPSGWTVTIANNLTDAGYIAQLDQEPVGTITNDPTITGFTYSNNKKSTNPLLVNITTLPFDFHLQSSSPAINAGMTLTSDVTTDFDNISRPQGPAFDIGAYEWH